MLLVLCDDTLDAATREWCRDALTGGLASVSGHIDLTADASAASGGAAADSPSVVWRQCGDESEAIQTAAAAAGAIVLVLNAAANHSTLVARSADGWQAAAAAAAVKIAVWLSPAPAGRADPNGELSAALGAQQAIRLGRVPSRRAGRRLARLGRSLVPPACAPQRLDRSDGQIRRRDAARAATSALSDLLDEPDVEEFQIRGGESMLVQYAGGRVERRPSPFGADDELIEAVRFLASYSGDRPQRFDELDPRLDVRVGDRWRLHAEAFVTSPPNVVLRSNLAGRIRLDDLGVAPPELGSLLVEVIAGRARVNVVIAAAMGGGKTTLCQALLAAVPSHERIDTIEDTPELRLAEYGIHANTYERLTRDPNQDGHGRHSMADHIRDAKRANAAKLVVGEIRGDGCEALLDAMSSGLDGCLVTLHSQPGTGVLEKLVAYACSEGAEPEYARRQIAAAVDLCVWMGRNDAGERVIADVTQLDGIDDSTGVISTRCLWALRPGDRWATRAGRPAGRVARAYASAGLGEVGLDVALPAEFSGIVDTLQSTPPPQGPSCSPVPEASAHETQADDQAANPALERPARPGVSAKRMAPVREIKASGSPAGPAPEQPAHTPRQARGTARPHSEAPATQDERQQRQLSRNDGDKSGTGELMWDPGPLVPMDDPPPYEPLVPEPWPALHMPPADDATRAPAREQQR